MSVARLGAKLLDREYPFWAERLTGQPLNSAAGCGVYACLFDREYLQAALDRGFGPVLLSHGMVGPDDADECRRLDAAWRYECAVRVSAASLFE